MAILTQRQVVHARHRLIAPFVCFVLFPFLADKIRADAYEIDVRADQTIIRTNHLELGSRTDSNGRSMDANSLYFLRDGKPWLPVMGEIHYTRIPREDWDEAILKMKANGIDIIATYVFWIHHEEIEGQFDWSGNRNLHDFVMTCQRHGVWVLPRIGPWCHGEVRNGGFPDWLLAKKYKTRSTDPNYMKYVERLYRGIGKQLEGLYFKDGGPILGIQLENEQRFGNKAGYDYMKELKSLAIAAKIDVPFYTCTGWPGIMRGQKEFVPVNGAYPDAPWDKGTKKLVQDVFRFSQLRNDPLVGADITGTNNADKNILADNLYPNANAELGGGMQVTYHRRPVVSPEDVVSLAFVRLGSGANMLGYYMFHGGVNPDGKLSTLQESRATKYPNDYPIINYDFQSPIGQWGQVRESYYHYRPIHYFVNDFGADLAPMNAFFPTVQPKGPKDTDTLRCAARAKDGRGFVFLSNYQRYGDMHDLKDVQLDLNLKDGRLKIPETPVSLAKNAMTIWPFNMPLADARLIYSTAQPLCTLSNGTEQLFVFFANGGVAPQYVFDAATVKNVKCDNQSAEIKQKEGLMQVNVNAPGTDCILTVSTAKGDSLKILTLTSQQAMQCWRGKLWGQNRLVITNGTLIPTEWELRIRSTGSNKLGFSVYPDTNLQFNDKAKSKRTTDGIFARYNVQLPEHRINISFNPCNTDAPPMSDELSAAPQPGQQYDLKYKTLPGSRNWRLSLPSGALAGLNNIFLKFDLQGDTAAFYLNEKLIDDWFIFGPPLTVGLKHFANELEKGEFKLQLMPFTEQRNIFLEDPDLKTQGLQAALKGITALPEYEVSVVQEK